METTKGTYTTSDLEESLSRVGIPRDSLDYCIAAWGESPEGYGSWYGGFLLYTKHEDVLYVAGWCDTSGWGCQDGAQVERRAAVMLFDSCDVHGSYEAWDAFPAFPWHIADRNPADLTRWLQTDED